MKKHRLISMLTAAVLFCLMPFPPLHAHAESGKIGNNITWEFEDGVLTLSGTGATYSFEEKKSPLKDFKKLIVGEGITELGDNVLHTTYGWTEAVEFPDSLRRIGDNNFANNTMKQITLPPNLESIGDNAFGTSDYITELVIPDSVKEIGAQAFEKCHQLKTLTLPDRNIRFGIGVFQGCSRLQRADLPDAVTEIPDYMFHTCRSLRSVHIPESCISIGELAFSQTILQEIDIPGSVKTIGFCAFEKCSYLSKITMHEGVETLSERCFEDCSAAEIRVPESVRYIGKNCFSDTAVQTLILPTSKELFVEEGALPENWLKTQTGFLTLGDGILYQYREGTEPTEFAEADRYATHGRLGDDITWEYDNNTLYLSGTGATYSYSEFGPLASQNLIVDKIVIGEGITEIGDSALHHRSWGIREIEMPDSLRRIGTNFIRNATGMEALTFPPHLEYIGEGAIINPGMVSELTIPDSVREISPSAFQSCFYLQTVHLPDTLTEIPDSMFVNCYMLREINIPQNCTRIGNSAFKGTRLKEIDIPGSVEEIGESAFEGCWQLSGITLHEGLKALGNRCFYGCPAEDVAIPESVKEIGEDCFYYEKSATVSVSSTECLPTLIAPEDAADESDASKETKTTAVPTEKLPKTAANTIKSSGKIGDNITWKLEDGILTISGTGAIESAEQWRTPREYTGELIGNGIKEIRIGEGITEIVDYAFYGETDLKKVTLPETLLKLGCGVFEECSALESIHLPDTLNEIPDRLFSGCTKLCECNIPASCTSIGSEAFARTAFTEFDIPETVTEIGEEAFYNSCYSNEDEYRSKLKKVHLPDSLTAIPDGLFSGCSVLEECNLPTNCTSIGRYAFARTAFTEFDIPETVTEIGEGVFDVCKQLKNVHLPDSMTAIPDSMFYGCTALETFNLPKNCTSIGSYAFAGTTFTEFDIPETVTEIGSDVFSNCEYLKKVHLPDSMTAIPDSMFYGCTSLQEMNFPANCTSIGYRAFSGTAFTEFDIPETVTEFGEGIFSSIACDTSGGYFLDSADIAYKFSKLKKVHLPDTMTAIPERMFCGCTSLQEMNFPANCTSISSYAFAGTAFSEFDIPETVTKIGEGIFASFSYYISDDYYFVGSIDFSNRAYDGAYNCAKLKNVHLPDSMTEIPKMIFYGCSALQTFSFPANCTSIGSYAFAGTAFSEFDIPETITKIGNGVFSDCAQLKKVHLPDTVTRIPNQLFKGCSALEAFNYPANCTSIGSKSFAGTLFSEFNIPETVTEISEGVFSECTQLKKVHLSDAITELPEEAFADCPTLQEINIPKSCKIIGNKAFYGTALSAIDIPGSVKEIGEYAFAECRNLTKITLHEGIEIIRSRCFSGCPAENVRIPKSVKKLSETAFIDVTDGKIGNNIEWKINDGVLTLSGTGATYSFTEKRDSPISDRQEKIKSVIIGEGITEIGDYTISLFYDDEVKEITLPDSLKRIGKENFSINEIEQLTLPPHLEYIGDEAFSSSAKITELVIPESVKEIGNDAFLGATSLQKLTLPETAIKLGCGIFQNCRSLETVHLPDTMTEIPDEMFYGCEALRECNFPANCTQIGSLAFADTDISEIDIPSHVKVLKSGAFSKCSDLNEITLHEGLESLGNKCFYGCPAKEIRVPDSVKYIGSECFSEMIQTLKLPDNKELQVEEDALPKNWLKKQTGFLILGDGILYQYREETGPDNGWIGNDITWEINDGVLTLSGTGATYSYSNTEKPPFAAYGNFITEISIGEGITELGDFLFYENIPLVTSVTFPDSLRRIGESAFSHNIFLGSVTFPPHLESIGTNAFDHIAITEIDIPDSVKEIGRSVFSYCDQLKTVRLPDTLTNIPEEIFLGCNVLEEITIPPSCTIIGADAFNQSGITAIDIPESVKKIGQRAFFYCYDLAQVTLHEGLETLGAYCFDNCYALSEIILPQSVKSIGKECFSSLTTVTKAVAPSQPRPKPAAEAESGKIGDNITWEFKDATLTLSGTGKTYSYRNYKDSPLCEISQKSSKIVIGEGITEIGNHVFTLPGESETEIVFPDSLLRIGDWNFSGYSAKQLTLPPNLEYIGEYAFYGMQNVTELVIPESVREIGADAFSNAWVLQKAALPDTDIIIREGVFSICGQLKTVQLPSGMTEIPNALFSGCSMLEKLKIPEQITKIGYSAFSGCKFRELVLPDTVRTICADAFSGCENLERITLPDGLETIGDEAFYTCPLKELRIPESVTSIGAGLCDTFYHDETAVQQTPDLTLPTHKNLQIAEGALPQRWLEKQKGFLTLGDGILYHYSTDETEDTLIVPDGVKTIYPDAFRSIRAKSLILPESLQEIRSGAFRECVFESVTFLAQDVSIADDACKSTSIKLIRSNYYSNAQIFAMDSGIPFTALTPDQPAALEPPDPETDLLPFGNNGGVFGESYTLTEKSKMCLRNYTPLSLRSDLEESFAENWKGSCYGLSAVTVLVQAGLLKPSALDPEAKTLHDIRPGLQAVDFINYYQMSYKQMLNIYLSNYPNENSQYQKLCHAIREAQDYNNGGNPFILTLLTGSDGSHAVVGYGLEAGSWTWNDQVYNRRIRIWDSNYFGLDDRCCIYFDLDTLNFTLPAYNIRYNMNKDSDLGRILLICDNPAEINMNPHPSQLVQGDLNRDKASTVADAVLFARYLAEDAALPASVCADAFLADSNGDDILDYTDLVAMLSGKGKQDN